MEIVKSAVKMTPKEKLDIAVKNFEQADKQVEFWTDRRSALRGRVETLTELLQEDAAEQAAEKTAAEAAASSVKEEVSTIDPEKQNGSAEIPAESEPT